MIFKIWDCLKLKNCYLVEEELCMNFILCYIRKHNIWEVLIIDREALARDHLIFVSKFSDEQCHVYVTIMSTVNSYDGGLFLVYGYGGTGKTFIWKTLSAAIRSKGDIVLNVTSSGIAALLLPGGRKAHYRFKIPINPNEDSVCNIK